MKKNIFIGILILLMACLFSTYLFAAGWTNSTSNIDFTPSQNVSIYWDSGTNQQNYAIGSKHTAGNRVYATTSATSNIYYQENDSWKGTAGSSLSVTMPSAGAADNSTDFNGWDSL